jgi:hypothetical protein
MLAVAEREIALGVEEAAVACFDGTGNSTVHAAPGCAAAADTEA